MTINDNQEITQNDWTFDISDIYIYISIIHPSGQIIIFHQPGFP